MRLMYVGALFLMETFSGLEVRFPYICRCQKGERYLKQLTWGCIIVGLKCLCLKGKMLEGAITSAAVGGGCECKTRPSIMCL